MNTIIVFLSRFDSTKLPVLASFSCFLKCFESNIHCKLSAPIKICITGAAGQIACSLVYMIGSGSVFRTGAPVCLCSCLAFPWWCPCTSSPSFSSSSLSRPRASPPIDSEPNGRLFGSNPSKRTSRYCARPVWLRLPRRLKPSMT